MTMRTDAAASPPETGRSGGRRVPTARVALLAGALGLAGTDLFLKAVAERSLGSGRTVDLVLLDLRLAHNSGAAFSLGSELPTWVVVAVTGVITAGVAVFLWRAVTDASWPALIGLSMVLAGAVANLADRAVDGVVTDYLHTGWWPTFNLADVFISLGAATVALALLGGGAGPAGAGDSSR